MEEISDRPDIRTQTCTVRTRQGRFLDLAALKRTVEGLGIGARLRGVEGEVEGELTWSEGRPALRLTGSADVVRLETYRHPVQWDFREKRARRIREKERKAFRSLLRGLGAVPRAVVIVGPLRQDERRKELVMEVRSFQWLRR